MPLEGDVFYLIDHRLLALAMVGVLLAACEIGYRLGLSRPEAPESLRTLINGIGGAMLGILGLLLGFALSMAIARWDTRGDVIMDEANAIGTLSLHAGLLEDPGREELREGVVSYTDARLVLGRVRDDPEALRLAQRKSERLHVHIWSVVESADRPSTSNATLVALIGSANALIDLHEVRLSSLENHLPSALFYMLLSLSAGAVALLAWSFGAASHRGRTPMMLLAIFIGAMLLLIMDVNRPQRGIITVGVDPLERVEKSLTSAPRQEKNQQVEDQRRR